MRANEFITEAHHHRVLTHKIGKWTVHFDSHLMATIPARDIPLEFAIYMINYVFWNIPDIDTIPRGKGAYIQDTNSLVSIYIKRSQSYPTEFTVETILAPSMKPTPPLFRRPVPPNPKFSQDNKKQKEKMAKFKKDAEERGRDAVSQDLSQSMDNFKKLNRKQRREFLRAVKSKK